jgi:GTA TIM-barrel-like domain/Putative phage tail protein
MATLLLSAAGAAVGSGFGGTVLGLSGAVIGRAVGATVGRVIDQKVLGAGSEAVETGRVDRFRLNSAGEGVPVGRVWGRTRVAGQVIWSTRFAETSETSGGGKGGGPKVTSYSYTVSVAIALCEGRILRVGRVWADGQEIDPSTLTLRVYRGSETQAPDPKIAAVEGLADVPAYRGIAYVVIEDLELGRFGNRLPAFSFEVVRRAGAGGGLDMADAIKGVALIPGTGEYSLATTPVYMGEEGEGDWANVNAIQPGSDFAASLDALDEELPDCGAVSLVVSWFGDDLRCGTCRVKPKVEQVQTDGTGMPWRAGGIVRSAAEVVITEGGRPVYGGTPADASVVEAIRAMTAKGKAVMFYPFVLMEQQAGNTLPNPWTGTPGQPVLPWRGRITTSLAPGMPGTPDRTAGAAGEVAAFFGAAQPAHFQVSGGQVVYSGPAADWGYRRFILHYAHLCALAGGIEAFCVGSELVCLTRIRGTADSFPAVAALVQLVAECRAILGPQVKLSYAADWSEYFGYHRDGNVYYHLDPLWSHPQVDFIGIDNYMPLSDWRDGETHVDASWGSIYALDYLKANIAGGEGFDWYYDSPEGEAAQLRLPITDGAHGEPWVFRNKDLGSWWREAHFNRTGAVKAGTSTGWVPRSKPFRFTEYGCAAIDRGTNHPNRFLDPKSSESILPRASNGARDDLIQQQYYLAMASFWADPGNNPVSPVYGASMLDLGHSYAWAWDARPFPAFPGRADVWGDAANYDRGHWLNGRATHVPLPRLVGELCAGAGVTQVATDRLFGTVRGFDTQAIAAPRASLQTLMLGYGFDVHERDGQIVMASRTARVTAALSDAALAVDGELPEGAASLREGAAQVSAAMRAVFREAEGSFDVREAEALLPDPTPAGAVAVTELPLVLTAGEAQTMVGRWLAEGVVVQDGLTLLLPPSLSHMGPGDTIDRDGVRYRIDRASARATTRAELLRCDPAPYRSPPTTNAATAARRFRAASPVRALFLDLPLLRGDEVPHAPYVAASAVPWPGAVGVWMSDDDDGFVLNRSLVRAATMGRTETEMPAFRPGLWDRGPALRVRMSGPALLSSAGIKRVLGGANAMAIGDGSSDRWEVFQFRQAALVAPRTYELTLRLRGQAGSDGLIPDVWPVGSRVVLLDTAPVQLDLPAAARGVEKNLRVGPVVRGVADPGVLARQLAFKGNGLRPYPVAHLVAKPAGGGIDVAWIRRTRIDGDDWDGAEVPLGEDSESYAVRVRLGTVVVRMATAAGRSWTYTAAMRASDGATGSCQIDVAQISARFGAGPYRSAFVPS